MLLTMKPAQTQPVAVITTVHVVQRLRIVEVFPQAIPVFHEISPGKWAKAA